MTNENPYEAPGEPKKGKQDRLAFDYAWAIGFGIAVTAVVFVFGGAVLSVVGLISEPVRSFMTERTTLLVVCGAIASVAIGVGAGVYSLRQIDISNERLAEHFEPRTDLLPRKSDDE